MTAATTLRRTALYDRHKALGAKMVPFAGWEMPVQYPAGILAEHHAVRSGVGIFDVSHMGEFEITGPDRNAFVNRVTSNDVSRLEPGGVQYSALLTPEGTFVDDCTVYRFDDKLMIVVNASNTARAWEHIVEQKGGINVRLKDISSEVGLLAVQGPAPRSCSSRSPTRRSSQIGYYHFSVGKIAGAQCFISRTGYTGEDGFELYCRERDTVPLWDAITARRRPAHRPRRARLAPARDGLRALRQRDRRHHHAARGRARLDREARQGRAVHRGRGAPRPEAARRHPATGRLPSSRAAASRATAIRCPRGGREVDIVRSGTMSPSLGDRHRHHLPARRRRQARRPSSRSNAAASACRRRW